MGDFPEDRRAPDRTVAVLNDAANASEEENMATTEINAQAEHFIEEGAAFIELSGHVDRQNRRNSHDASRAQASVST